MNINKNSWHYKVASFGESFGMPSNLCPYVRKFLCKCLVLLAAIFLTSFVLVTVGAGIVAHFTALSSGVLFWTCSFFTGILSAAAVIGLGVGIVYLVMKTYVAYNKKKEEKEISRISAGLPPKEKSFIYSWFEAKHDKICPTLEYTNDKS